MEVDGRVGERRGNKYISKRISTWAGYTTIISDYVDLCVTVCVFAQKAVPYFILDLDLKQKVYRENL